MLHDELIREIERQEKARSLSDQNLMDRILEESDDGNRDDEVVDIIEFVRAEWGLNENPFPVQRFILKLIFGVPLDDRPDDVIREVLSPTQFRVSRAEQFGRSRIVDIGENRAVTIVRVNPYTKVINLDREPVSPLQVGDWVTARIVIWDKLKENIEACYNESEFFDFIYGDGPGSPNCRISLSREEYNLRLGQQMNLVVARIGRRGAKSSVANFVASYFCYKISKKYNPQAYYQVRQDQAITITLVATAGPQAEELLAPTRAAIKRAPILRRFLDRNKGDSAKRLILNTNYNLDHGLDSESGIKVTALPCSAKSTRGPANILGILEEFGFFYSHLKESQSNTSDKEIYSAIAPSTADLCNPDTGEPEGLILIPSTPLTKESYMHEIEESIWERKTDLTNSFVIHLPSWWTNPLLPSKKLKEQYALSPADFWREYGADYAEQLETALDRPYIELCREDPGSHEWKQPGEEMYMGFDMGLTKDWTVISVVAMNGEGYARLIHHEVIGFNQTPGWEAYIDEKTMSSLDIRKIADQIDALWVKWSIRKGLGDQFNAYGLNSHLKSAARDQLDLADATQPQNDRIARNFLAYIQLRKLTIYAPASSWEDPFSLVLELSRLKKQLTGGTIPKMKLIAPSGRHDDQYSAVSRALFIGQEDIATTPPVASVSTPAMIRRSQVLRSELEDSRRSSPASVRNIRPTGRRFPR